LIFLLHYIAMISISKWTRGNQAAATGIVILFIFVRGGSILGNQAVKKNITHRLIFLTSSSKDKDK
jgi:hypothetical protein